MARRLSPETSDLSISKRDRFHPSRVSCVAHYQRRTKGDPTSILNEFFPEGRLKIHAYPATLIPCPCACQCGQSVAYHDENFCCPARMSFFINVGAALGILGTYLCLRHCPVSVTFSGEAELEGFCHGKCFNWMRLMSSFQGKMKLREISRLFVMMSCIRQTKRNVLLISYVIFRYFKFINNLSPFRLMCPISFYLFRQNINLHKCS